MEAEQEFQESDLVFYNNEDIDMSYREMFMSGNVYVHEDTQHKKKKKKNDHKIVSSSVPVPNNNMFRFMYGDGDDEKEGGYYYDQDGEIVPPHVIVGRRIAGQMEAFSVCTGNGRTLKGRDLSQVRNSVLKMTGFLET